MPTPTDFSNFQFGQSKSAERQQGNFGTASDFGQTASAPETPEVPAEVYPNIRDYGYDPTNPAFSSDKEADPQRMAEQADGSAFADLQQFLNNSPYTAGSRVCHELNERWKSPHDAASGTGDGKTGPA